MAIEKNRKIQIRLSEEELETLNEYVKEKNTTKSDVVRDHIKNLKTDKEKWHPGGMRKTSLQGFYPS